MAGIMATLVARVSHAQERVAIIGASFHSSYKDGRSVDQPTRCMDSAFLFIYW